MAYFKKEQPRSKFYLSNGNSVVFPTYDGSIGYVEVHNPATIADFRTAQQNGRGGISEVSKDEYDGWLKKKQSTTSYSEPWRDELKPASAPPPTTGLTRSAAPAEVVKPESPVEPAPAEQVVKPVARRRKATT